MQRTTQCETRWSHKVTRPSWPFPLTSAGVRRKIFRGASLEFLSFSFIVYVRHLHPIFRGREVLTLYFVFCGFLMPTGFLNLGFLMTILTPLWLPMSVYTFWPYNTCTRDLRQVFEFTPSYLIVSRGLHLFYQRSRKPLPASICASRHVSVFLVFF